MPTVLSVTLGIGQVVILPPDSLNFLVGPLPVVIRPELFLEPLMHTILTFLLEEPIGNMEQFLFVEDINTVVLNLALELSGVILPIF